MTVNVLSAPFIRFKLHKTSFVELVNVVGGRLTIISEGRPYINARKSENRTFVLKTPVNPGNSTCTLSKMGESGNRTVRCAVNNDDTQYKSTV